MKKLMGKKKKDERKSSKSEKSKVEYNPQCERQGQNVPRGIFEGKRSVLPSPVEFRSPAVASKAVDRPKRRQPPTTFHRGSALSPQRPRELEMPEEAVPVVVDAGLVPTLPKAFESDELQSHVLLSRRRIPQRVRR